MYLKRLEMQGFKSFAEKISLQFGTGITAVVGPNGSGKSNISDAIRWVMGEQSAKSLRGGNMQDVIFSGTQKRKPLGFAEVSLVVDNADKTLQIDYDEVVITRRVYRSGESEYYINSASCRLKDIHELFMDTGVGREGYSIIGQGKIVEIISSKAEDRRQIFEEAAGITKYRYRKEEAERKLAHTHDNVLRVSDIITELETQLEPLRQQSEKAKKFLNLRDKLKTVEVNVSLENIARLKKALDEAADVFGNLERQTGAVKAEVEGIERTIAALFEDIKTGEEGAEQLRVRQESGNAQLSGCKSDIEVLKSRIAHNDESVKRIGSEIDELQSKLDELDSSLSEKDGDYVRIAAQEEALAAQIAALTDEIAAAETELAAQGEKTEQISADMIEKLNEVAAFRLKNGNLQALSGSFETRKNAIEKELEEKKDSFEALSQGVLDLARELKQKTEEKEAQSLQYQRLSDRIKQAEEALSAHQGEHRRLQIRSEQAHSRYKLLSDMEKSFDNYSKSVKSVMQALGSGALKNAVIHGTVAQLITVPKTYEVAIETALGSAAQNIVTGTENDAKTAIEYLKRNQAGRATFLPVTAVRGSLLNEKDLDKCSGYLGIASDLVTCDNAFENVVGGLLGRVAVVDTVDNAIVMAKKYQYRFRIVTKEGELLTPGGAMSGGSRQNGIGLFARANELAALADRTRELQAALQKMQTEEQDMQRTLAEAMSEGEALSERLRRLQEACIKLSSEHKHSEAFLQSAVAAREALTAEHTQTTEKIAEMATHIQRNNEEITLLGVQIAVLEKQSEGQKDSSASLMRLRDEKAAALLGLKMEQSNVQKDIALHAERTELVKARKQEIAVSIAQKRQNIAEINDTNEDLADDIGFKTQQIEEIAQELIALKEALAASQSDGRRKRDDIQQNQKLLGERREVQFKLQEEQGRLEGKKAKSEFELENIINRLWEDYELTVSAAEKLRTPMDSLQKAQREINALKEEIRSLGNINIDAIEEYTGIKERFDFLTTQRDDLVEAQKNLEAVIADMVLIMKDQFAEKFKIINQNFSEVFAELFGGGKAQLTLTEPDDILSSGVGIEVQPPGKAVKSIIALSGGEQAFVSIALLFAILKVRPSPFCILDEIEAALDDVNVFRYAEYLKKFAQRSQFIVVTHRRGTMEAANVLYGVTMQEQGVTNLLSLNIDDIEGVVV